MEAGAGALPLTELELDELDLQTKKHDSTIKTKPQHLGFLLTDPCYRALSASSFSPTEVFESICWTLDKADVLRIDSAASNPALTEVFELIEANEVVAVTQNSHRTH